MGSIREQTRPAAAEHIDLIPGTKPRDADLPDHSRAAEKLRDTEERRKHQGWFFVEWQCDRRCD